MCASLEGPAGRILWETENHTNVEQVIKLLRSRFGSINQAERFRTELRSRKRLPGESLQQLYQDICRLMALSYPGPSSELSDIVGRDAGLSRQVEELREEIQLLRSQHRGCHSVACKSADARNCANHVARDCAPWDRGHPDACKGASLAQESLDPVACESVNARNCADPVARNCTPWDPDDCKGASLARESVDPVACKGADARNCAPWNADYPHASRGREAGRPTVSGFAPTDSNVSARQSFKSRSHICGRRQAEADDGCYQCGSPSHWARDCPKSMAGQSPWTSRGKTEHRKQWSGQ